MTIRTQYKRHANGHYQAIAGWNTGSDYSEAQERTLDVSKHQFNDQWYIVILKDGLLEHKRPANTMLDAMAMGLQYIDNVYGKYCATVKPVDKYI